VGIGSKGGTRRREGMTRGSRKNQREKRRQGQGGKNRKAMEDVETTMYPILGTLSGENWVPLKG